VLHEGVVHIGRAEDNEVVLADVGVSRRHARLEVGADAVVVEDLGSGNGTWFRGQSVRRQVLGDGEEVAIDPFTLRVTVQGGLDTHEVTAGRDSTASEPEPAPLAMLTVTSAHRMPVRHFPLPAEGVLTLGRSERNAIVLPEPASSRVHAEVRCEAGRFTLRDHGSSNGTFVNGRRVKERQLEEGDRIRIDIPNRRIDVLLSDQELAQRRAEQDKLGWKPVKPRPRKVSAALKAYAMLATSADKGAVRDLSLLGD